MKKQKLFFLILASLLISILIVPSCTNSDDFDFEKLSDDVNWTPNMTLPLGYGSFTLWYLINPHDELDEEKDEDAVSLVVEDGLLHIKKTELNVFEYDASEVISFPDQTTQGVSFALPGAFADGVPKPVPPGGGDLDLGTENTDIEFDIDKGVKLSQLDLSTIITFEINNPLPTKVRIEVGFPTGTQGAATASHIIEATPGNSTNEWNLSDLSLNFSGSYDYDTDADPGTEPNTLGFNLQFSLIYPDPDITPTVTIPIGSSIDVDYTISNIQFDKAEGDFGQQVIDIGSGGYEMGMDLWEDIDGSFTFSDPRINLTLRNGIGVPFSLDLNLSGYNEDQSVSLNPDVLEPAYPTSEAEVDAIITSVVSYNKTNSQIVELMALPPTDSITYSGEVALNPTPVDIGQPNIIKSTSTIGVDLEMDIPMDFSADNLTIKDTIDDVSISDAEKVKSAKVTFIAKNGLPLDVKIGKIYFTDENYNILDSIMDSQVFTAAEVFPVGHAQEGEVDVSKIQEAAHSLVLTESIIAKLNQTENVIIEASIGTGNSGTPVKLLENNTLEFSLAIQAEADLND